MQRRKYTTVVIVIIFICAKEICVVARCEGDENSYQCVNDVEICYGGSSGITADDVLRCMLNNGCDVSYRIDACDRCDKNPSQYEYNSKYKDCTGKCYDRDKMNQMKKVDICGVCDGTNSTCNPSVTGLDVSVIPSNADITFNITGEAMLTNSVQILLLRKVNNQRKREAPNVNEYQEPHNDDAGYDHDVVKRAANKVVERVLDIVKIYGDPLAEIRVQGIDPGSYEIMARTGQDGEEYLNSEGPTLLVYDVNDYSVSDISPNEQDLDEKVNIIDVSLTFEEGASVMFDVSQIYELANAFSCYYSSSENTAMASESEASSPGTYNPKVKKLSCDMEVPEVSKAVWVCPSFNKIHLLECQSVAFYELAPNPVGSNLTFTDSGNGLYVDFDKAVESTVNSPCTTYFSDTSSLGAEPKCYFNDAGDRLNIMLGESNTVNPGDTLELKAGLKARDAEFKRESAALNLTLVVINTISAASADEISHIKIAKVGSWPEKLTALAESPITLEIEIVHSPGGRPPKSIVWSVNQETKDDTNGKFTLVLDVTKTGQYDVIVTATDFLRGTDSIEHTILKTNDNLPNVVFSSTGIYRGFGTQKLIYPNTIYTISTSLTYPEGTTADNYDFQWRRNGVEVPGTFTYKSKPNETTIDMCEEKVNFTFQVSSGSKSIEYVLNVWVKCRSPIAEISGNDLINIDVRSKDVILYGHLSRDPDGGTLTYKWLCSTLGNAHCIDGVTKSDIASSSITILPSKMRAKKKYAIFLTVSVNKSGQIYNNTDRVVFAVQAQNRPVIRWVTIRTKFRHDVPIMMRAYVGDDVTVTWKFRDDLNLYEYIDASDRSIGKSKMTDDGFAWYRIQQGVLKPGKKYKLQINVTKTDTGFFSTDDRDIYVYETLKGCSIETHTITEFEEATILLRNCNQDPDVTKKFIMCTERDKELPISKDNTFIVPRFKSNVDKIILKCKIMDDLGNIMLAEPKEIVVTKASAEKTVDKMIEGFKQNGDKVKALALVSEMAEEEDDNASDESLNTKAVGLIKEIVSGSPSEDDINLSLKSYGKLKVDKIKADDTVILAEDLVSMLDKLCRADKSEATTFDADQTKHILRNTKRLMASNPGKLGKLYRKAEKKLACIKFKHMKNEDSEIIQDEDGTKHAYLVNVLEDIPTELGLEFPEELKVRYRDQWNCKQTESCFGVGVMKEEHPFEPPDLLQYKRADNGCRKHVIVNLFNTATGEVIDVINLEGTINMNLGSGCKRGKCWYRDELLQRYSQDGVTTVVGEDGSIICQSNHLTAFTAESEPEQYEGVNIPYIISLCIGGVLLLVSLVILVKLWLVTKHRASSVEDERHFALDDVPMYKDVSPSFTKR